MTPIGRIASCAFGRTNNAHPAIAQAVAAVQPPGSASALHQWASRPHAIGALPSTISVPTATPVLDTAWKNAAW